MFGSIAVPEAVAVDTAGDVIVGGSFQSGIDLGNGAMTNPGALVGKLDANGHAVWSKALGVAGAVSSVSFVASDSAGNIYVTGTFQGSVNCGGGAIASAGQGQDVFVAKPRSERQTRSWATSFGDGTNDLGLGSMALDGGNGIVLAGIYSTSVTFGGATLTPAGGATQGAFVVERSPPSDGSQVWSKGLPQTTSLYAAVDSGGNVVLAGAFSGSVNVGGGALTSAGGDDILVARLDPSGNHLWSKRFGGGNDDEVNGVAVDGSGAVLLAGLSTGGIDFGGGTVANGANGASFAAKLSQSGGFVFSDDLGTAHLQSVAATASGNVLVGGSATGTITVGTSQIPVEHRRLRPFWRSSFRSVRQRRLEPPRAGQRRRRHRQPDRRQRVGRGGGWWPPPAPARSTWAPAAFTCSAACFLVARLSM